MKAHLTFFALMMGLLSACASERMPPKNRVISPNAAMQKADYSALIEQAEHQSRGTVQAILRQARIMTLWEKAIVQGGCWDYLDAVWTRAGAPRNVRQVVFKGDKKGSFAPPEMVRAGDWLYHINYGYRGVEHSGMFIAWVDESRRLGLTLSYAGEHRKEPARYRVYDLSGIYHIMRAKEQSAG